MPKKIEISHRTIVFTIFFLIFLWILYQIRQVLIALFISVILMAALNPAVDRLTKFKIPRFLAISLLYILIIGIFVLLIAGVVPPLVDQTSTLISRLPEYTQSLGLPIINQQIIADQISQLGSIPANIVKLSLSIFSNLFGVLAILMIAFYLLMERRNLNKYLTILFGGDGEKKAEKFINEMERKLGGWVRAQLILMIIVGLLSYIGLRLLGIEFALPLALLAGVFEIIPNIGPIASAVPAFFAGFIISPLMGLAVAALYFLIQQLENSIIVPKVMEKEVGINPIITILALAIGFKLAGITGAALAIPAVLVIRIIASEIYSSEKFRQP